MFVVDVEAFKLTDATINATCAVMCASVWLTRRRDTCFAFWAGGFLLFSLVATLMAIRPPTPLSDSIGFSGIALHMILVWAGFRAFDGRRPLTPIILTVPLAPIAIYFLAVASGLDATTAQHAAHNALQVVACAQGLHIMDIRRPVHAPRNLAAYAVALMPVILLIKMAFGIELLDPMTTRGLLILSHNVVTVILIVSVLAMVGERDLRIIQDMAQRDPLTGALNRSGLKSAIAAGTAPQTVLLADLDHFKTINDRFGHSCGDEVLRVFAERTQQAVGPSALLVRFGGEEFLIVSSHCDAADAERMAEKVRSAAKEEPVRIDQNEVNFTVSVGLAIRNHGENLDHTIKRADVALYQAKEEGRDCVVVCSQHRTRSDRQFPTSSSQKFHEATNLAGR